MKKARVFLVGAGPGDPGLIAWKGLEILRAADVVVHDALVSNALLAEARADAVVHDVGKRGGRPGAVSQEKILKLLAREARAGRTVVRLKGGDPFIFGRGSQEAEYLAKRRIPFEVVPGVPAALGAAAYAGIPLTDRRWASDVVFVTGTEDPGKLKGNLNWQALGALKGTLVVYMGVQRISQITATLMRCGRPSKTPAAVISWGTLPQQRVVAGTLKDIARRVRRARLEPPALLVVGHVVRFRRRLSWFERKPLFGKRILITRATDQAGRLRRLLEEQGAQVLELPLIACAPTWNSSVRRALARMESWDWILFTSPNGVDAFFQALKHAGRDARALAHSRLGAVGPGTAEVLCDLGLSPDLVARPFTTQGLYETLKRAKQITGNSFLLVRSSLAGPQLERDLKRAGASVTSVPFYETRVPQRPRTAALDVLRKHPVDIVTFTSASTAENLSRLLPRAVIRRLARNARFLSIGPVTTRALRRLGFRVWRQARSSSLAGLLEALGKNGGG